MQMILKYFQKKMAAFAHAQAVGINITSWPLNDSLGLRCFEQPQGNGFSGQFFRIFEIIILLSC